MNVISNQRHVEEEGEPLPSKQEQKIEEHVKNVLGQNQRVQAVALVDGVLVVGLQFIKSNDLKKEFKQTFWGLLLSDSFV